MTGSDGLVGRRRREGRRVAPRERRREPSAEGRVFWLVFAISFAFTAMSPLAAETQPAPPAECTGA
jgi:hypothetical protein